MDAVQAVDPENMDVAGWEQRLWSAGHGAPASGRPFVPETSAELLRTIAGVLDIRAVFPRISDIVKQVVPHDSLALRFSDRPGPYDARGALDPRPSGARMERECRERGIHDRERSATDSVAGH